MGGHGDRNPIGISPSRRSALNLHRAHRGSPVGGPPGWARHSEQLMLGVVLHAGDVHDHHGVVAHHPGIMAGREPGLVSGTKVLRGAIIHDHMQAARDVVLQVRDLAALSLHERFDARGPFPAGLQRRAPEGHVVDGYRFYLALVERARLVRTSKALLLHLFGSCYHNILSNRPYPSGLGRSAAVLSRSSPAYAMALRCSETHH